MSTVIAALLLLASGTSASSASLTLPAPSDAVDAYFELDVATCNALIDVCETDPLPIPANAIENLICRTSDVGTASCRFEALSHRCKAHFVSADAAQDYERSVSRSHLGPGADQSWAVAWHDRVFQGPRIKCKRSVR